MSLFETILIAIGLAMDASAVCLAAGAAGFAKDAGAVYMSATLIGGILMLRMAVLSFSMHLEKK